MFVSTPRSISPWQRHRQNSAGWTETLGIRDSLPLALHLSLGKSSDRRGMSSKEEWSSNFLINLVKSLNWVAIEKSIWATYRKLQLIGNKRVLYSTAATTEGWALIGGHVQNTLSWGLEFPEMKSENYLGWPSVSQHSWPLRNKRWHIPKHTKLLQ